MAQRGKNNLRKDSAKTLTRPVRSRGYDQLFLIVCEDQKTEPAYFQQFIDLLPNLPHKTLYLECIGTGLDPLGVVTRAVAERDKLAQEANREVDFVWAVFDKDDADVGQARIERFKEAYQLAEKEKINIAFSNESFELWLLLHFEDVSGEVTMPRAVIYERLQTKVQELLGDETFIYLHGDAAILERVAALGSETLAAERAKALEEYFTEAEPLAANPSTGVFRLVALLREWVAFYGWKP